MNTYRRLLALSAVMLILGFGPLYAQQKATRTLFDTHFTGGTLRIDCLRYGNAYADTVWPSRWLDRNSPWHGSRTRLVDPFDKGEYRVEIRDTATGEVLYSRGYSNLFREYCGTDEGKEKMYAFEETLLLPMPRHVVHIVLQKRDRRQRMRDATTLTFDPALKPLPIFPFPNSVNNCAFSKVAGPSDSKIDLAVVAQGYDGLPDSVVVRDIRRLAGMVLDKEPFASHADDFNIYGVRGDAGAEFNTFGSDRYLMTGHVWQLHDVLGTLPCDFIIVMVNDERYGGGGIYNFYAATSLNWQAQYVLPHELGHAIGGLADEYVDEELSYASLHQSKVEPVEPNITNLKNFEGKWQAMLAPGTPVPTPPDTTVSRKECGPLGVYEGAGYAAHGMYRPAMHCMMRDYGPFCPVCSRRLEEVFGLYTR